MRFNLQTLIFAIIALFGANYLAQFQDNAFAKVSMFIFVGYALLVFATGVRQGFKLLFTSKEEEND